MREKGKTQSQFQKLVHPASWISGKKFKVEASYEVLIGCDVKSNKIMNEKWTDHLEYLTKKLFPSFEDFNRDDPFPFYSDVWFYFLEYIKSFDCTKIHKSFDISWNYLSQGNALWKCISERISCYTQSIFYAPENSPTLIIAYLKRSELLNELGLIRESKNDSAMALQCFINNISNTPEDIIFMNTHPLEDVLDKIVRETSRKMNIPDEELPYVEHEVMNILRRQLMSGGADILIQNDEWNLPELKDGENVNFPSSSKALKVQFSKTKGRHVVANCDIKMGDVLFVEKPFSLVVHKLYCSYCCQRRYTYFPCLYCRDVQYCCKGCRDEDWVTYHKYECGFVDLLKQTGIGYLALKTFLKAESDIDKLKNLSDPLSPKETSCSTDFSKVQYENVYNLFTNSERIGTVDFLQYSLTALLLSFYLIHYAHYAMEIEENVRFCASILLRHIIQLVTNAHAITATESKVDENCRTIFEEQEQIGSAIYPSVSIMNHSCEPSVFITFHKYYIIVKASKDLKKGEEVLNSYGVDCRRMSRRERQELLKAQYLFDCKCGPCCEKYDRYDILNSFKCGHCKGPLVKESTKERGTKSEDRICLLCSQRQIIPEEVLSLEFYIGELLKLGEYHLNDNNVSEALVVFLKAWKLSREFFFAFHKHISCLSKKIALCLFRLNYLKDCMNVLSRSIICVQKRFGLYSSELAIEAKKLSDVISHYCRTVRNTKSPFASDILTHKEKEYFQMCEKILRLLHGDDHPIVLEAIRNNPLL